MVVRRFFLVLILTISCFFSLVNMYICILFSYFTHAFSHVYTYCSLHDLVILRTLNNKHTTYCLQDNDNKSDRLTQNTPVVFVVNSMVMTTFLGAGYSTWRADTANSVFGQFKGHNSGMPGGFGRF